MSLIIEIRPGVGGQEAALFVQTLYAMYHRYAERVGWQIELLNAEHAGAGFSEVMFRVSDKKVGATTPDVPHFTHPKKSERSTHLSISRLFGEAGVHCIQRISPTDSRKRVHTSTATVAILTEPPESDARLRESDLRTETMRAHGHGGQGVNKVASCVKITHIPTGISATCQDERSQHRNRERALAVLRARLAARNAQAQSGATQDERTRQIGHGDRAERIRTYDVPDDLVTDRRLGRKVRGVRRVLRGDLDMLLA